MNRPSAAQIELARRLLAHERSLSSDFGTAAAAGGVYDTLLKHPRPSSHADADTDEVTTP